MYVSGIVPTLILFGVLTCVHIFLLFSGTPSVLRSALVSLILSNGMVVKIVSCSRKPRG